MALYNATSGSNYREYAAITAYDVNTFTVFCRFRQHSVQGALGAFVCRGGGGNAGEWYLGTENNSPSVQLRFSARNSANTLAIVNASSFVAGEWDSLAGVMDGTNLILYKGGLSIGSTALSGVIGAASATIQTHCRPAASAVSDADIDDVRIFNRALSAAEILAVHRSRDPKAIARESLILQDMMLPTARDTVYKAGTSNGTLLSANRPPRQVLTLGLRFPFNTQPSGSPPPPSTNSNFFFAAA